MNMTELRHRHVEGINPDDEHMPHIAVNAADEVDINNNINNNNVQENQTIPQGHNNNVVEDEAEIRAFEMISRFPYSYAKYSLTIFNIANITAPIHIIFSISSIYYTWEERGIAPFCFRLFLFLSLFLSFINIPIRYRFRQLFLEINASHRRRATMLTKRLGRNQLTIFNKYSSVLTYLLIACGFISVYFFRSHSGYLRYSVEIISISMFGKALLSAFLLFYYLKDAFEYGDGKELTNEELSVIQSYICENDSEDTCSICWTTFKAGDRLKSLPCPAHHTFHDECIDTWIRRHTTCPICRNNFGDFIFGGSDDEEE